jgi:hypothetical protein
VYGVVVGGQPKAYPLGMLRKRGRIADSIAGIPVVVSYDDEAFSATIRAQGVRLPGTFAYWFAWRGHYPSTALYDPRP